MLTNVLNAASVALPVARIGCYATAGFLVGRKASQAAVAVGCKMGGSVAELFNKNAVAKNFNDISERYTGLAKHHLTQDLKKAAGFIAAGLACEYLENNVALQLTDINADKSFLELGEKAVRSIASIPGKILGEDKYPVEKLVDVANSLRITRPVSPLVTGNAFGLCGSNCAQTTSEVVSAGKELTSEWASYGWDKGAGLLSTTSEVASNAFNGYQIETLEDGAIKYGTLTEFSVAHPYQAGVGAIAGTGAIVGTTYLGVKIIGLGYNYVAVPLAGKVYGVGAGAVSLGLKGLGYAVMPVTVPTTFVWGKGAALVGGVAAFVPRQQHFVGAAVTVAAFVTLNTLNLGLSFNKF